jgi:bifunctional N-acetylglucosamine-1-phosphate-uridyltransferase/glucosamine-1-phosphate-acetyltransferase GlmU-like protein
MWNSGLNNIGAVILAAGRGTRLNCLDKPKVMLEIGGKPIVSYIVDTLKKNGFKEEQIVLVVGFKKEKIMDYFGDTVSYAVQEEQLGTGHAAYVGMKSLPVGIERVMVMGGDDGAFYSGATLLKFIAKHLKNKCAVSLLSVVVKDPSSFGRIVDDETGIRVIEKEYLTEDQKSIHEVSTGTYVFDRKWFEKMFPAMPPLKKLGEYGLPTALAMANSENKKVQIMRLKDNNEWFGINTPDELAEADRRKLTK